MASCSEKILKVVRGVCGQVLSIRASSATAGNIIKGSTTFIHDAGGANAFIGANAGNLSVTGTGNVGAGFLALRNLTGGVNNTALGSSAITSTQTGHPAVAVLVDINGQLGVIQSSRRFKDDIVDMGESSTGLMRLRPVTFRYLARGERHERPVQFGLIAEEVAEVFPELVVRTPDGEIETVMYQHLAPMLLNEVQKQQRMIDAQAREIARLAARLDRVESASRR